MGLVSSRSTPLVDLTARSAQLRETPTGITKDTVWSIDTFLPELQAWRPHTLHAAKTERDARTLAEATGLTVAAVLRWVWTAEDYADLLLGPSDEPE